MIVLRIPGALPYRHLAIRVVAAACKLGRAEGSVENEFTSAEVRIRSFEADIDFDGLSDGPLRAIFIRAPWIAEYGPDVEILAEIDGHGVAARQGQMLAVAFHSELGDDDRVHRMFLRDVRDYAAGAARSSASQP